MARVIDVIAIVLFLAAAVALGAGLIALDRQDDFRALYLLAVGALALRASSQILRPRGAA